MTRAKPFVPSDTTDYGARYKDTGCRFAPHCLSCPFPRCYLDDPKAFRSLAPIPDHFHTKRNKKIRAGRRRGRSAAWLAERLGVSTRTVYRVVQNSKQQ